MSETQIQKKERWTKKIKAFGPGILMASAAIGGSHIVSSTQAGALYGWQLAIIILLVNIFKYPFFRFGTEYTLEKNQSLIEGYYNKRKIYLILFFIMNIFSTIFNVAAIGVLTAAILFNILPAGIISIKTLTTIILIASLLMMLFGGYKLLDKTSKVIVGSLTVATIIAVIIAIFKHNTVIAPDFVVPSAWTFSALPFMVSLMGWMPAPIEIAAVNSMWTIEKQQEMNVPHKTAMLDLNVGYFVTTILAFVFLALGALIQYGTGTAIKEKGAEYIAQFIQMYSTVIGQWSYLLIAFIAFMCIFGTSITILDGFSRANAECLRLLLKRKDVGPKQFNAWMIGTTIAGLMIVYIFAGSVPKMLNLAMIFAFISAPIYSYLNYSLVKRNKNLPLWLNILSILGLVYLTGFTVLFLLYQFKFIG